MSTLMKWLIMLLAWLAFCIITFRTCVKDSCCTACTAETQTEEVTPPPPATTEVQRYPIDFQWDNPQAFTNDGYDAMRADLISKMGDDNELVITGNYYASEVAPPGYSSMGIARAAQLRDLLMPDIDSSRVVLTDLRLDDQKSAREGYFQAVKYQWRDADGEEETEIIELENKVVIRFPYSSAVKDTDPAVDAYLDKLAQRLATTTERVKLTGHTDDRGSNEGNMRLSERRAKYIRDILVRKGVATSRIEVKWEGEDNPTSSNDTDEGRHNNRRVELEIMPGN